MLTEEEKEFVEMRRKGCKELNDYRAGEGLPAIEDRVVLLADRLSARCEELEKEREAITRHGMKLQKERDDYFRIIEKRGVQITNLCDNLDAIKKAWEPFKSIVTENKHMESFALVYDDDVCAATFGALRTLDKLIGGEK